MVHSGDAVGSSSNLGKSNKNTDGTQPTVTKAIQEVGLDIQEGAQT